MSYERMTKSLNQIIFSFLISLGISALMVAFFGLDVIVIAIFLVPLAFIVAWLTTTESLYKYKDEVSLQQTFEMVNVLLKALAVAVPIVLLYSALFLIIQESIPGFKDFVDPLFEERFQALPKLLALPMLYFMPIFFMISCLPFPIYIYGKVHDLIWGGEKKVAKSKIEQETRDKSIKERKEKLITHFDKLLKEFRQYNLELQAIPKEIDKVAEYKDYKNVLVRLEMIRDYVKSVEITSEKEKEVVEIFAESPDLNTKNKLLVAQRSAIITKVKECIQELEEEKKEFSKPEEEY